MYCSIIAEDTTVSASPSLSLASSSIIDSLVLVASVKYVSLIVATFAEKEASSSKVTSSTSFASFSSF